MIIHLKPGEEVRIITDEGEVVVGSSREAKVMFVELHGEHERVEALERKEQGVTHLCFQRPGDGILTHSEALFIQLAEKAVAIRNSGRAWEEKYDMIFSEQISKKIAATDVRIDYYDPDTSYEEDVNAYVNALIEKVEYLKGLKNAS